MPTVFFKSTPVAGCRAMLAATTLALSCAVSPPADRGAPAVVPASAMLTAPRQRPVCNSPTDRQVEAWLAAMTLDEKVALVAGTGFDTVGVPRLHVPSLRMTDGPVGVRVGQATAFPAGELLAATFDPALVERVGAAIAREAKGHGKNVLLGPAVNIVRTALCGRNFEYYGEDPELAGRTAVAYIKGVQSQGVLATVKHFAANNQETERMSISAEVDARALREIYLPAFEAAVKEGGVWAVMCAYNRLNGVYACENPGLIEQILRQDWGFCGLVMSDWGATHSGTPAMRAGLDLEMPKAEQYAPAAIRRTLDKKQIEPALLDEMVRRQLRAIAVLHLDEDAGARPEAIDTLEHRALNREAARSGFVLLKNDEDMLPLDRAKLRRIAVVGPRGGMVDGGGGSAHVMATNKVSLVDALREALGSKVRVDFAPGDITPDGLEPIPASVLEPPAGHTGQGLLGEYFVGTERKGAPKLVRVDATVNFHWELAAPAPGLPEDGFSVRWTGKLTPPKSGLYVLGWRELAGPAHGESILGQARGRSGELQWKYRGIHARRLARPCARYPRSTRRAVPALCVPPAVEHRRRDRLQSVWGDVAGSEVDTHFAAQGFAECIHKRNLVRGHDVGAAPAAVHHPTTRPTTAIRRSWPGRAATCLRRS